MIHETAIVDPKAKIGAGTTVGPWSYIGPDVVIGDNCQIDSHVVIKGPSEIGNGNRFFSFSTIGEDCQDKKYQGEATRLVIGSDNIFREHVTVHRGTIQDNSITIIGSNNLVMVGAHIAHDVIIGDNCIFANNCALAGHVHVGDWVILGGQTGIHQFVKIGSHSFLGASSLLVQDLPPYVMAAGNRAEPRAINVEGLKRRGFSTEAIREIRNAYKLLYRKGNTVEEAADMIAQMSSDEVKLMSEFIGRSERGIIR